jgi:3-isopropylmalate/(R)-2-methylmalate dehydratase small subunit
VGYTLSLDLPTQTIGDNYGFVYKFEIAPSRKEVLLQGLDDIAQSLEHAAEIDAHEKSHAATATMFDPVDVKNYRT